MSKLIEDTRCQLKQIIPGARDIFIKVKRDHHQYISKIHVRAAQKILHAEKKAETSWEALHHSYDAIRRQVDKLKTRKIGRRKIKKAPALT